QAGDLAGVLGGLPLAVVEVGRHRDDGLADLLTEVVLGGLLHLLEDERRDLGRAILLAPDLDPGVAVLSPDDLVGRDLHCLLHLGVVVATADEALDGENRVLWIGDRLTPCDLTGQALAAIGEGDDAGGEAAMGLISGLVMTSGSPPSMTATQELVVPRSIPMTLGIV